jgi:type I restriction enzyme S subunit
MNDELPGGWASCELRHSVDVLDSQRVPVNSEERANRVGNVPYYGATGQVGWIDEHLFDEELLLIGEDGAPFFDKSKPIAYIIQGKSWVNNHAHVLRAKQEITSNHYLKYFLDSFNFHGYVNGTTRLKLTQGEMNEIPVPLPPLGEQRRIVAKLEKLLGKVDDCQQKLVKIPIILKRFRQSVLAAACSGRLTADWRERNHPTERAEDMVERIRRRRMAGAKTESQREKLRDIYERIEENDSNELPDGWRFVVLGKLCESFDYGTSTKSQPSGKVPVLRMGNIQNGKIDWADLVYTSDEEEIQAYNLEPNTVLFNRTNSPELVGKTAIFRGERSATFAGYLIRINAYQELNPEYLNYCLNTSYAKEFCLRVKTDGVSQSNINAQKLGAFEVPLCPISEQNEIVRRVEALLSLADQIEKRYTSAKRRVAQITQSLFAKAFRGELVPQNPDDEPASVLLERIKTERTKPEAEIRKGDKVSPKRSRKRKKP